MQKNLEKFYSEQLNTERMELNHMKNPRSQLFQKDIYVHIIDASITPPHQLLW